jgi:purine-cytosine permease-like protein
MNNFILTISQHFVPFLFCLLFIIIVFCIYSLLHFYTLKRMFDNDSKFEEWYENGQIKIKSYHRNIWDLSLFPPLSKLFFTKDWKFAMAVYLLLSFLVLYVITEEQWFAELIKVNFGLVIGALVGKRADDSP